jgi:hypothetical protein
MRARYFFATGAGIFLGALGACSGEGDTSPETLDASILDDGGADAATQSDALADAAPDAPDVPDSAPPPNPPFDWVGVIGTGQSLSIGATAGNISKTQPFKNLKLVDEGPDPKYPIDGTGTPQWSAIPLVEPIRAHPPGTGAGYSDGQYPGNIAGETPHSGMANTLSALWTTHGGAGDYVTAHSVVGWSGHCLKDIDKAGGKRAYPASLAEAKVWKQLATTAGKSFGYGGIVLTHGECDAGNVAYGKGLHQLWQDYNADLKAITGQTTDVLLLASQQSVSQSDTGSAAQLWHAGNDYPGAVVCSGPKYQFAYSGDNLHFPAPGYARLGQKYAEIFDIIVNQHIAWKPLQPRKVARVGAVITIDFDVPNPPLAWDEHLVAPHKTAHAAWAQGRGFEVVDGAKNELSIASVTLEATSVVLTLTTAPPAGTTLKLGYAMTQDGTGNQGGTVLGYRGQLRDSDELVGHDLETIEVQATNGSPTLVTTKGFVLRAGHDLVTGGGLPADTIVVSARPPPS